jgi:hypothetical protein
VMKRRSRHLRPEQVLVFRVRELKERQGALVGDAKETVAIDSLSAEKLVGLVATNGRPIRSS